MKHQFRVWSYPHQYYLPPELVCLDGNGVVHNLPNLQQIQITDCSVEFVAGVLDCKGTPVYDGDIIEIKGSNWLVSFTEGNGRFDLVGFGDMQGQIAHIWHAKEGAIVGNLHQNLDLIRGAASGI